MKRVYYILTNLKEKDVMKICYILAAACIGLMCLIILVCSMRGGPRIDASSQEAIGISLREMAKSLSEEEGKELFGAIQTLLISVAFPIGQSEETMDRRLREKIDGKTAQEVIVAAKEVRREEGMAAKELRLFADECRAQAEARVRSQDHDE